MDFEGQLKEIAQRLHAKGWSVATAESCTGGLLAGSLTDLPGASTFFRGGVVSYCDAIKAKVLGVEEQSLLIHSAVSAQVALEMAEGVRQLMGTDIGVSTTGLAGPGGDGSAHPVGTVFVSLSTRDIHRVESFCFSASRQGVRQKTLEAALEMLLDFLRGCA